MIKRLFILALSSLMLACSPAEKIVYVDVNGQSVLKPGESGFTYQWIWTPQDLATTELADEISALKTPGDIQNLFFDKYVWKDDYDIREFLSPNTFNARKKGVCSAFARYWQFALSKQGVKADFIAFWSPQFAHAVCVFRGKDTDGNIGWFMGSNRSLVNEPKQDLNEGNPGIDGRANAWIGAAQFFVGDTWTKIEVYDENGKIIWRKLNEKNPKEELTPGNSSKNIFSFSEDINKDKRKK